MSRYSTRKRRRGQSLIEVLAGSMFMIPIALFGLDVVAIAVAHTVNNHLAKDAARAAANQEDSARAAIAAKAIVEGVQRSGVITSATLDEVRYQDKQQVSVKTTVSVLLPAPFPFLGQTRLVAEATEPVVGVPVEFQEAT